MGTKKTLIFCFFFSLLIITIEGCDKLDLSRLVSSTDNVNERFKQSEEWNNTHPVREILCDSDSYSLYLGSDIHMGGTENFNKFISAGKSAGTNGFVLIGDLCSGHKEDYDVLKEQVLLAESTPCYLIAGNHDLFYGGWETFYNYFGSSTYIFTVTSKNAQDLFICLETGSASLGTLQMDWLKNIFSSYRSNYRNCIILSHTNMFQDGPDLSTNPDVDELYVLFDLFADNNVNMVINGHYHDKMEDVLGNTTYLVLDALEDGDDNPGYLELLINDTGITYHFVSI
jgi:UDP-2,3-diacylglucosamine pyrophosphatase LpxH